MTKESESQTNLATEYSYVSIVIMTFDLIVTALVRELKCCNYTFISSLLIIFNWLIKPCHGKGGAVGAAAAAGGATGKKIQLFTLTINQISITPQDHKSKSNCII